MTHVPISDQLHRGLPNNGRTLVIEDSAPTGSQIAAWLREIGMEVTLASNNREAIDLLDRKTFDLVVLDIGLADGKGLFLAKFIKNTPRLEQLPIIGCTANVHLRQFLLDTAFAEILLKPLEQDQLLAAVQRLRQLPATPAVAQVLLLQGRVVHIQVSAFFKVEELIVAFAQRNHVVEQAAAPIYTILDFSLLTDELPTSILSLRRSLTAPSAQDGDLLFVLDLSKIVSRTLILELMRQTKRTNYTIFPTLELAVEFARTKNGSPRR